MTDRPITTMVHEGCPPGRLMRMRWYTPNGSRGGYYIIPDDGRKCFEIPMREARPYPAFDAMQELSRISKIPISQMLSVEDNREG